MKKVLTLLLAMMLVVGCLCFTGCKKNDSKVTVYNYTKYEIVDKTTGDVIETKEAPIDCCFIFSNFKTPEGYFVELVSENERNVKNITWNFANGNIAVYYNELNAGDNVALVSKTLWLKRVNNKKVSYTVENDATTNKVMYFEREVLNKPAYDYEFEIKKGAKNSANVIEILNWASWKATPSSIVIDETFNGTAYEEGFYTNKVGGDKRIINLIDIKFNKDGTCVYVEGNRIGDVTEIKCNYTVSGTNSGTITLTPVAGGSSMTFAFVKETVEYNPRENKETVIPAEIRVIKEYSDLSLAVSYVLRGAQIPVITVA
jgi:PBP1b-binding outer membrane lipoprotein LpoB